MQNFHIVNSIDLSIDKPVRKSGVIYTRLFGKGKHNIYQFTDEELPEVDQKIMTSKVKMTIITFHDIRMNTDAMRFKEYKKRGTFPKMLFGNGSPNKSQFSTRG